MDIYNKISVLGPSAQYDTCGPRDFGKTTSIPGVYHATLPNGAVCRLFKVLQTNTCKNNCNYCAYRKDRDCERVYATPDEMADAFDTVYHRRLVDGLFLSSGILGTPDLTMSRMLDTVHILRGKYKYRGYVHLKLMPGTSLSCIQEAIKVSSRISLNIESPTQLDLSTLSQEKDLKVGFFKTLLTVKRQIDKYKLVKRRTPSLTTQFVVGAGNETDENIMKMTNLLYKEFGLYRVFYSAFRPVKGTPLSNKSPESLIRQHRLYQSDFLLRFYRFMPSDLPLDERGNLFETADPKLMWAQKNRDKFPLNINKVDYWTLLKIPGIGPESASKIVDLRKKQKIYDFSNLSGMRIQTKKMLPWVIF